MLEELILQKKIIGFWTSEQYKKISLTNNKVKYYIKFTQFKFNRKYLGQKNEHVLLELKLYNMGGKSKE